MLASRTIHEPDIRWELSTVLAQSRGHDQPLILAPSTANHTLCGHNRSLAGIGAQGCDLEYQWSQTQLATILAPGSEHGRLGLIVTGKVFQSSEPIAANVAGQELAWAVAGKRGAVYDVWWFGPASRTTTLALWTIGNLPWGDGSYGGFSSVVAFLCPGWWTYGTLYSAGAALNASGPIVYNRRTTLLSRGPAIDTFMYGEAGYFERWHHLVVAVNPLHVNNGSIMLWTDGFSRILSCQEWGRVYKSNPQPMATDELGLPPDASRTCDLTNWTSVANTMAGSRVERFPADASNARINIGLDPYFNRPGVLDGSQGGHIDIMDVHITDSPYTLANHLVAYDRSPQAMMNDLAAVAGATASCARTEETSTLAGRVLCQWQCHSAQEIPTARLDQLCALGLRSASSVLSELCHDLDNFKPAQWTDWSVWQGPDGVRRMSWVPISYSTPSGMSGLIGAVAAGNTSLYGTDSASVASLARWAMQAPWKSSLLEEFPPPAMRNVPTAAEYADGPIFECAAPSALTDDSRRVSQTVALQVCLGGASALPGVQYADSATASAVLNNIMSQMQTDLIFLLNVSIDESWRVTLPPSGYVTAESALAIASATVSSRALAATTVDEMCQHPARDGYLHTYGSNSTSSCVCAHAFFIPRNAPGLVAAGRAAADPIATSASFLGPTAGLSMAQLTRHITALTSLVSISNASIRLMPVYQCVSISSRVAAIAELSIPSVIKESLSATLAGLDATYAVQGRSFPSFVPCLPPWWETLSLLAIANGTSILIYLSLLIAYIIRHGSLHAKPSRIATGLGAVLLRDRQPNTDSGGDCDSHSDSDSDSPVHTAAPTKHHTAGRSCTSQLRAIVCLPLQSLMPPCCRRKGISRAASCCCAEQSVSATSSTLDGPTARSIGAVNDEVTGQAIIRYQPDSESDTEEVWLEDDEAEPDGPSTVHVDDLILVQTRGTAYQETAAGDGGTAYQETAAGDVFGHRTLARVMPASLAGTDMLHHAGGVLRAHVPNASRLKRTTAVANASRDSDDGCDCQENDSIDDSNEPHTPPADVDLSGAGQVSRSLDPDSDPAPRHGNGGRMDHLASGHGGRMDHLATGHGSEIMTTDPSRVDDNHQTEQQSTAAGMDEHAVDAVSAAASVAVFAAQAVAIAAVSGYLPVGIAGAAICVLVLPLLLRGTVLAAGAAGCHMMCLSTTSGSTTEPTASMDADSDSMTDQVSARVGAAAVASISTTNGGIFGRHFAVIRRESPPLVAVAATLTLVDFRGVRFLFAGFRLSPQHRTLKLSEKLQTHVRRSLALLELWVSIPLFVVFTGVIVLLLFQADNAVCGTLSEASARELAALPVACRDDPVCLRIGCSTTTDGLWSVGIPVAHGIVWTLVGVWARIVSVM